MIKTMDDLIKKCSFRVRWSEEDSKWLAQCPTYMDLFALHVDPALAIRDIESLVRKRMETEPPSDETSVFEGMDRNLATAPGPFGS